MDEPGEGGAALQIRVRDRLNVRFEELNLDPPRVSTDKSVKYDYDLVYVRLHLGSW